MPTTTRRPPSPTRRRGHDRSRATRYAEAVLADRLPAGKLVRLACERHASMIRAWEAGETPELRWDGGKGGAVDRVTQFFGRVRQFKGRWAGETLGLLDWQAFCIQSIFGWQRWDAFLGQWVRLYREAYISVARKNGKSTIASVIGLWLLDFDGEPGAEVYFAATKRDQAKQCFEPAVHMLQQNPDLQRRIRYLSSTVRMVVPSTGSVLLPLGRDADSEHGLNVHGAIIDELHVARSRDLVDALDTATGARSQPLIVYITTAGVEGVSIWSETDDRARRVVRGISQDPALFVFLATLDEDDDWTDPRAFRKANPSLGVTIQQAEIEAACRKAIATPGMQPAFKRLRLNMRTQDVTAWMDISRWDRCALPRERRGKRLIGVDLGGTQDLSAAAVVTVDQTGIDADLYFWMPEQLIPLAEERDGVPYSAWVEEGWITPTPGDYRDDAHIADDLSRLSRGALEFDLDQWNSTSLIPILQERGYICVVVPQTFTQLSPAVAALEDAVAQNRLCHDGNPVMRWMLTNTALDTQRDGGRKPIKMTTRRERRRIDGVSALLDALSRLEDAQPPEPPTTWGFGAV